MAPHSTSRPARCAGRFLRWLAGTALLAAACAHAPPAPAQELAPAAPGGSAGVDSKAGPPRADSPATGDRLGIFYVTDRAPEGRLDPRRFFGCKWGEPVFGIARVKFPPPGRLSKLERSVGRTLRGPGMPIKQVKLESLAPIPADSFFAAVAGAVAHSERRRALVFVHGYKMAFEPAARFTAGLRRGIGTGTVAILYSWPASPNYLADEEAVRWTERHLEEFLTRLAARIGAGSIDLVGYSMGTRPLMEALVSLGATGAPGAAADSTPSAGSPSADSIPARQLRPGEAGRFGQVVLAAPDLEARTFARRLPLVTPMARRVTLYASSRDRALRASHKAHGHARAGEAGRYLVILPGMDTIDVTAVRSDLTGHGYLEELRSDLELLLGRDAPPDERPGLSRATRGEQVYWRMTRR